jgi:enoyl-CoA hydratase
MAFAYKDLQIENRGSVWILKIHRPTALNALNSNVLNEMGDFLRQIGEMSFEHAKALIITGAGDKSFVAGADIKEISKLNDEQAFQFSQRGQLLFHELSLLQIPVVAAVNGFALGGGLELALACDFIFASENAKFGLPEVSLGLIPGFGGTVRLLQAVGLRRARQMTYTGDMIDASEALRLGLVNHVTTGANLMSEVQAVVDKMLIRAPAGISYSKKSINFAWDHSVETSQKEEAKLFSELFQTQDVHEGTKAFLEKRKPQFQGQ